MPDKKLTAEGQRLNHNATKQTPLEKWGPYLSERQWGTVREDYSAGGDAWNYLSHDAARSRAYLWGEDGIGGLCDYMQDLCFAPAFWNGADPILKERLFGLTNGEGNHGEDAKELWYHLDNLPSHYYMKYLYKYPQTAYPYQELIAKNKARTKEEPEAEILDTDAFANGRYFDIFIEYAKQDSEDIFIKIEVVNRYHADANITVLPTLWFYNRWQYGGLKRRPGLHLTGEQTIHIQHERLGERWLYFQKTEAVLFTENETNTERIFGTANASPFVKDAFHNAIIEGKNKDVLIAKKEGTKCAPVYQLTIEAGGSKSIYLRLCDKEKTTPFAPGFEDIFIKRREEADEFYASLLPENASGEIKNLQRKTYAGLLWSKQYYHLDQERWLNRSNTAEPLPPDRATGRNHQWRYLKNQDVISMPDKWEYPWYAAWDTAFHAIAMAAIDPVFAKGQLVLFMREWYMSPEGQLPAYEWNFSDVNPPVHAFAALEVYRIEKKSTGVGDVLFLKKIFQKLIINFTWWANREDSNGNNIFEGGFLGLDNIGLFNRGSKLPGGAVLEQADGTSWMGMYALNMMEMAVEIAATDIAFEDACTKFYEHFVLIAEALNELGLWNADDQFFYDSISVQGCGVLPIRIRSVVGLTPLYAVTTLAKEKISGLPDFIKRMAWFKEYRVGNGKYLPNEDNADEELLLSLVHKDKLLALVQRLTDEEEFLSVGGVRALSKCYSANPYRIEIGGEDFSIKYDAADATSGLYGGNSNWRGPVWFPVNYLLVKALQQYGDFYEDEVKVECPNGSGNWLNLRAVAAFIQQRLLSIFLADADGNRPLYGPYNAFYQRPENRDLLLFHEYFNGDTGMGLGASHQTGWTALIAGMV